MPPFRQFLYAPFQRFGARRGAPARRLQKALLAFRKSTTWNFYTSKCFSPHQVMLFAVAYGPQKTGVFAEKIFIAFTKNPPNAPDVSFLRSFRRFAFSLTTISINRLR